MKNYLRNHSHKTQYTPIMIRNIRSWDRNKSHLPNKQKKLWKETSFVIFILTEKYVDEIPEIAFNRSQKHYKTKTRTITLRGQIW